MSLLLFLVTAQLSVPERAPISGDEEVWQAATRVDEVQAYQTYLIRWPRGLQATSAEQRIAAFGGRPLDPQLPGLSTPSGRPASPAPVVLDACSRALLDDSPPAEGAGDIAEFRTLRRSNRLDQLQQFVAVRGTSACWTNASRLLEKRLSDARGVRPIPGMGPLHAHKLSGWTIAYGDYPASALRANEQGTVVAAWDVAADGAVENCRVVRSSGSATLDLESCARITRKLRYDPARDAAGVPVRATDLMAIDWRIGG